MQYNPRGQMIRETFGTNTALYQRKHYNRRGQLFDIRLGTDSSSSWDVEDPQVWQWANGSWNRGALRLFYSPNLNDYSGPNPAQTDNNGNIYRMDHFVPNALDGSGNITSWVMSVDAYTYDELNRLTQVTETPTGGGGPGFTQKFIYDRWGNRRIDIAATSNVGGGVTRIDFKVLTANNRLVAPSDMTGDDPGTDLMRYDKAGNLVYDNYSAAIGQRGTMTYDAENRMLTAVNGNHQYRYEADGKRTRRMVLGQTEMWLVYGINGELVAEYDASFPNGTLKKEYGYRGGQMLIVYDSTLAGDEQLKWMVTDHLGSIRMLVNRSGSLSGIQRRDYLPFGEEQASSICHRNASGAGYVGGNNPRQKFGSKERDAETGLDFFEARYFSSIQGRFTSPDEFTGGPVELFTLTASANPTFYSDLTHPQSLNKYQYCYNNPLRYIDSDGHEPEDLDPQSGRKKKEEEEKIQIKTADTPKILDVKVKLIDPVKGEVPIGGEFEIKYKYAINDPSTVQDAQKPGDYGSIQPVIPTGTFTDVNNVGLVGEPKVVVNPKKETVEVEKTERYVVKGTACGRDSCAINFKVVVTDPVNTDKTVTVRSVNAPGLFDKSPSYIPVRNIPKPEKRK